MWRRFHNNDRGKLCLGSDIVAVCSARSQPEESSNTVWHVAMEVARAGNKDTAHTHPP